MALLHPTVQCLKLGLDGMVCSLTMEPRLLRLLSSDVFEPRLSQALTRRPRLRLNQSRLLRRPNLAAVCSAASLSASDTWNDIWESKECLLELRLLCPDSMENLKIIMIFLINIKFKQEADKGNQNGKRGDH